MRIAMVSADYLPNIGGVAGHVHNLSRALARRGHEVTVFKPTPGSEVWAAPEVPTVAVRYRSRGDRAGTMLSRYRALTRELGSRLDSFDVLHQHDHAYSSLGARALSPRLPWIWTNHTSSFLYDVTGPWRRRYLYWLYRPTRAVIVPSEELLDVSSHLWPTKQIGYIPNGVDTSAFHPNGPVDRARLGLAAGDVVVLCPRRLVPVKGALILAQAAVRLSRVRPEIPWRFVFVGAGNGEDPHYRQALDSTLEPLGTRAVILPATGPEGMAALYAASDVVALPSFKEATSLAALEAMAMKRPVVASRVGGLVQLLDDGTRGILVTPGDAGDLADGICTVLDDAEAGRSRVTAAYDHVMAHHTWDHIAAATERFYQRVIA